MAVEHAAHLLVDVRVLRDDASPLELDGRDHHAITADESTTEIGVDLLFRDVGPTKVRRGWRADGIRHGFLSRLLIPNDPTADGVPWKTCAKRIAGTNRATIRTTNRVSSLGGARSAMLDDSYLSAILEHRTRRALGQMPRANMLPERHEQPVDLDPVL